ncbi:MAG: hypothetical protein KH230_00875 [Enterocloster asparagiformis]|nr:hypothetical protein [Enterocloster asparagiformis]
MMKDFFDREWCYSDKCMAVLSAFLCGVVVGIMISPVKRGIYCGNHNGNTQLLPKDQE